MFQLSDKTVLRGLGKVEGFVLSLFVIETVLELHGLVWEMGL